MPLLSFSGGVFSVLFKVTPLSILVNQAFQGRMTSSLSSRVRNQYIRAVAVYVFWAKGGRSPKHLRQA